MTKLHLGCGDRKIHGFINIDGRPEVNPDEVCEISKIDLKYKDVDLIYAAHVLEHFPLRKSVFSPVTWSDMLYKFNTCLKPGGILRLSVPDIEIIMDYYLKTKNTKEKESLWCLIWGGQKYDYDFHYHGWTFDSLKKDLENHGFTNIRRYDWKKTEHFYIDDYSQAYMPHMDKVNGTLLSLNVEATKE